MKNFYKILMPLAILLPVAFLSCKDKGNENDYIKLNMTLTGSASLDKEGQTRVLTVSSPAAWNLSSDQDWLTPSLQSGAAGPSFSVTLEIDENTGEKARAAKLTLTAPGTGKNPATLTITQLGTSGEPWVGDPLSEWIYDVLKVNYYWNKSVQAASPTYGLPYDEFLEDLLIRLDDAKDPDGTMDGGYSNGERYIYSYIEQSESTGTRAKDDDFMEYSYGFDFIPMWYDSSRTNVVCFVTWTRDGSPAAEAGLERGMWIEKFNGKTMTLNVYNNQFLEAYYGAANGSSMSVTPEGGEEITMRVGEMMEMTPIVRNKIVDSPGGKHVAYFMYNEFEVGIDLGGYVYKFNEDMRAAFGNFKGNADELVVDLRYNHGGYTYCCQILSSLAGNVNRSLLFNEMRLNSSITKNNPEKDYFLNETNSLKLNKLYVLTTGQSASSSELFIHSLRGVGIDVIQIGEKTEGKNVGMHLYEKTLDGYDYEFWPITFKSFNALGETSNPNGMEPDYPADDWVYGEPVYDLGDVRETLLKTALDLIDGKTPKASLKTRVNAEQQPVRMKNTFKRKQLDGARIFPGEIGDIDRQNP